MRGKRSDVRKGQGRGGKGREGGEGGHACQRLARDDTPYAEYL